MSRQEVYAAYDAVISLEASGDFRGAGRVMRSINKYCAKRSARWTTRK